MRDVLLKFRISSSPAAQRDRLVVRLREMLVAEACEKLCRKASNVLPPHSCGLLFDVEDKPRWGLEPTEGDRAFAHHYHFRSPLIRPSRCRLAEADLQDSSSLTMRSRPAVSRGL